MYRQIIVAAAIVLMLIPLGVFAQEGGVKLAPDAPKGIACFDRLIGVWDLTISNGSTSFSGTWEFRYILGGNAVYDESSATLPNGQTVYGANVRIYDPAVGAWKTKTIGTNDYTWRDYYKSDADDEMIIDYVEMPFQQGEGTYRWRGKIHDITADSFKVTAEVSMDDGETWKVASTAEAKRHN